MTRRALNFSGLLVLSGSLACSVVPNPLVTTAETSGDGDGDSGDGDGDSGDGDSGDGDGDGDGDSGDGDGDDCIDLDLDGYGLGCDAGSDCDDSDFNVHSDEGCANCVDIDMDDVWVGCDQYREDKPGPDCDDNNAGVGLDDSVEICNGLAENCAGEIDNASPDEMCPPMGVNAPNVAPQNGWACNPPAPGEDGCEIIDCVAQFFDLNGFIEDGCECEGTPRTDSLAACSDAPQGDLGDISDGMQSLSVVGTIPMIDNGIGAGDEDWYHFFSPASGSQNAQIEIDFQSNSGSDYRFEVRTSCNGMPFDSGLSVQFGGYGVDAYVRVYRVQNDQTCNDYQLRVQRFANP